MCYIKELSDICSGLLSLDLDDSNDLLVQLASSVKVKRKFYTSSTPPKIGATFSTSLDQTSGIAKTGRFQIRWKHFELAFLLAFLPVSCLSAWSEVNLRLGKACVLVTASEGRPTSSRVSYAVVITTPKLLGVYKLTLIWYIKVMFAWSQNLQLSSSGKELRHLHYTVHLRALKAMVFKSSGPFITPLLELKLDSDTMFKWQWHSPESTDVPHFSKLLEFLNLQAQSLESSAPTSHKSSSWSQHWSQHAPKPIASFMTNTSDSVANSVLCGTIKYPLYICPMFKSLSHDKMITTLKDNNLCLTCLKPGHYVCVWLQSHNRCRTCQRPHHSPNTQSTNTTP